MSKALEYKYSCTIGELIKALEQLKDEHGDIKVMQLDSEYGAISISPESIRVSTVALGDIYQPIILV